MGSLSKKKAPATDPNDTVMMSTPSEMASSKPAKISAMVHPSAVQTLYTAILAEGTPPLAFPDATPKKLASSTMLPAAVEAVWVP